MAVSIYISSCCSSGPPLTEYRAICDQKDWMKRPHDPELRKKGTYGNLCGKDQRVWVGFESQSPRFQVMHANHLAKEVPPWPGGQSV